MQSKILMYSIYILYNLFSFILYIINHWFIIININPIIILFFWILKCVSEYRLYCCLHAWQMYERLVGKVSGLQSNVWWFNKLHTHLKFNSLPLKSCLPKRKVVAFQHHFVNFGSVLDLKHSKKIPERIGRISNIQTGANVTQFWRT